MKSPRLGGECGPCPDFASYTLAFALQLRKNHGKTSVRASERCSSAYFFLIYALSVSVVARKELVRMTCDIPDTVGSG